MKSFIKYAFLVGVAVVAGAAIMVVVSTASSVISAPSRVLNKTLQTDNIINNYEWYFDVNGRFNSRVAQIAAHRDLLGETTDAAEKSRLRVELSSIQQSCRDLANQYNANAAKLNRRVFRDWSTPASLNPNDCE